MLAFYLLGIAGRLLLRYWVRRKMKQFGAGEVPGGGFFYRTWSAGNGFSGRTGSAGRPSGRSASREGEVIVTQTEYARKKVRESVGEYVEYEEIRGAEPEPEK